MNEAIICSFNKILWDMTKPVIPTETNIKQKDRKKALIAIGNQGFST